MSPEKDARPAGCAPSPESDPLSLERVRDILHQLANTVSAMKIFPSEHATVKGFVDVLCQKIKDYLAACQKLEIGIEEYSFTCGGKAVFTDEMTIKSLPFFFFKDGMQALFLYQGLEPDEIRDFLELIRRESQKPAGDSDIVTALWERDFANIQYFAPDEYLENRILEERSESQAKLGLPVIPAEFAHETIEVKVDTSKFSQGRVELLPEDRQAVRREATIRELSGDGEMPMPVEAASPAGEGGRAPGERSPAASMDPTLTDGELRELETLVRANRTISPEEEFIDLMVEIIFLEDEIQSCAASLDVLFDYHLNELEKGRFPTAVVLVHKVQVLRQHLADRAPGKSALLEAFLKKIVSDRTLDAVKELLAKNQPVDWEALLGFFRLLGPSAVSLSADLYESLAEDQARAKVLDFIRQAGERDPGILVSLANDSRPSFSKEVVGILARSGGKKEISRLSAFVGFQNKEVKLEAVHALGQIRDEMAGRILLGFLNDRDEDVRIQAALKLNPQEEKTRIRHLVEEASSHGFRAKSLREKKAIFSFLGRTRDKEALEFLRKTLEKPGWLPRARHTEMRVAAASGLESAGTPETVQALERGARSRNRSVQDACAQALIRLASASDGGVKEGP